MSPGPARTNDLSILRRALLAYANENLQVDSTLEEASSAIQRIPDADTGMYRVKSSAPDPAGNLKAYYRYWGGFDRPRSTRKKHRVITRLMLQDVLDREGELDTRNSLTWEARRDALNRLRKELAHPQSTRFVHALRALEPVNVQSAKGVRNVLKEVVEWQDSDGKTALDGTLLLPPLLEAVGRAGIAHDKQVRQVLLAFWPSERRKQDQPPIGALRWGDQLAGDWETLKHVARGLMMHYLSDGLSTEAARAQTLQHCSDASNSPTVREMIDCKVVDILLDLDRGGEAFETFAGLRISDVDEQVRLTARVVRQLLVSEGVTLRCASLLREGVNVANYRDDAVTGGQELGWLSDLMQSDNSSDIPLELFAYWSLICVGSRVKTWSVQETAELLVWATARAGWPQAALEIAADTISHTSASETNVADQHRRERLLRLCQQAPYAGHHPDQQEPMKPGPMRPIPVAHDEEVAEKLRALQLSLMLRRGRLSVTTQQLLWGLTAASWPENRY